MDTKLVSKKKNKKKKIKERKGKSQGEELVVDPDLGGLPW